MATAPAATGPDPRGPDRARPGRDEWRDALRGLLPAVDGIADQPPVDRAEPGRTSLALQFELRELAPRTVHRWNAPVSTAARSHPAGAELNQRHRLGVRPVVRTARGWARSGVTWSNITHLVNRLNLDREQHRWFCEFGAIHRAVGATAPGRDPDWIYLDSAVNGVLWNLLDQTEALGIQLVGIGRGSDVRRAQSAALTLDAVRDGPGIRIAPRLTIDDHPVTVAHARPIGDHGIYLVDPDRPRQIVLAPTDGTMGAEQQAFLAGAVRPTAVPGADVAEFLATYLPELQQRLDVGSSDSSVPLPPPAPSMLVLTLTHLPRHTLSLEWHWQGGHRSAPPPTLNQVLPAGLLPAEWINADPLPGGLPLATTLRNLDAAEFATGTLRRLFALPGVRIDQRGPVPDYRELTGIPRLVVTALPTEKHDWFDLGVTVIIDGRTIPFLPLFKALAKGRRKLLLVDGSFLSLNHPSLKALSDLIEESRDLNEWAPVPSISLHQLSLWADFEDLADQAVPAVQWRALLAEAKADAPVPVDPPAGLLATLRPYQQEGFSWLAFLWRHQLGGILADDMGLGKTVQCLALIQHVSLIDKRDTVTSFLIVAPTSVVPNWVSEAQRFTPGLRVGQVSST